MPSLPRLNTGTSLKERLDTEVEKIKNEQNFFISSEENVNLAKPTNHNLIQPKLTTMAKTFFDSTSKWIKNGAIKTDEETFKKRLDECRNCEFWNAKAIRGTGRCMKCGCSTWAKLRMSTEKCPIGKW